MLKSTHRQLAAPAPLPEGWTEHKAPSGHVYYYHKATKSSTYTRPSTATEPSPLSEHKPFNHTYHNEVSRDPAYSLTSLSAPHQGPGPLFHPHNAFRFNRTYYHSAKKQQPTDRPKSKQAIPGCAPWLLVNTKLGRRFVHNPEQGKSFWKFPPEVLKCVIELDRQNRERKDAPALSDPKSDDVKVEPDQLPKKSQESQARDVEGESDESYEEVEVTDEDEEGEDDGVRSKRQKVGEEKSEGPVEFTEDDIAYQLAAAEGAYEDYGEQTGEWDDYEDEQPLSEEDSKAMFIDLLEDFHISPFKPWESIIDEGTIIDDVRYSCLPNMKSRKEVFGDWSRTKAQKLQEEKQKQARIDPRVPYMALLENHATPKLYWVEFKRKHRNEPELRDTKLSDKEREKWYREFISRLKLSDSTLKSDLKAALEAQPLVALNSSTSISSLPASLLTDMRYVSVRAKLREPLVEAYISTLPAAPEDEDIDPEQASKAKREKENRKQIAKALAERRDRVEEEKRRQRRALHQSKGMMEEGEKELDAAMKVGREGLLGHFEDTPREAE